jgi:hypothetical protein
MTIDKDDHFSVFKKPIQSSYSENSGRYKPYKHIERELDGVIEYFKWAELKKSGNFNRFAPENPFKRDFEEFVENLLAENSHLPEEESMRILYSTLELKQKMALNSLERIARRVTHEDLSLPDLQSRIPNSGQRISSQPSAVLL